jgi:hypothetical protein
MDAFAARPGDDVGKANTLHRRLAGPVPEHRVEQSRLPADRTDKPPESRPLPGAVSRAFDGKLSA